MNKPLVLVALVVLVAVVVLLLQEGGQEPATSESALKVVAAALPAQQLEGVVLEGADDKGGHWKVNARTAQADAEGSVGVLTDVTFELIGESGMLKATAKKCAIDADSSIELSGEVGLEWDQWSAQMHRALYDMNEQSVSAESDVKVTGKALRVTARTLEIDLLENMATMGGVKAVFEGKTK